MKQWFSKKSKAMRQNWSEFKDRVGLGLLLFASVLTLTIILLRVSKAIDTAETLDIAVLTTLVIVTMLYAKSTRKMATEMKKQAEIALNGQFNAVAPVIELDGEGRKIIWIGWRNVGTGPALNFRCWIEDKEHPELRNVKKAVCLRAIAASDDAKKQNIDTEIADYRLGIGHVRAQYESILGKTYESCLFFPSNAAPELKYGEAKEIVIL